MSKNDFPWAKLVLLQVGLALATFLALWFALPMHTHSVKLGYVDTAR